MTKCSNDETRGKAVDASVRGRDVIVGGKSTNLAIDVRPKRLCLFIQSFEHSSLIRHSSFVIRHFAATYFRFGAYILKDNLKIK
jgi:hypothetical protein